MTKRLWFVLLAVACFLAAASVALAQGQDIEGGKDHPLISRYPGSWIIAYGTKAYDEYLFPPESCSTRIS
jgi:OmpA-OmpF porin, OOP family